MKPNSTEHEKTLWGGSTTRLHPRERDYREKNTRRRYGAAPRCVYTDEYKDTDTRTIRVRIHQINTSRLLLSVHHHSTSARVKLS